MPGLPMERSRVEIMLWEKFPDAASEMSISQLAMLRMRATYSERDMEKKLNKDHRFAWIFANPDPMQPRPEFNRKAIRTCCFYTVVGFKWKPGKARGVLPAFNLDQLSQIHAMVFGGAVERSEFLHRIMEMRAADLITHAAPALASLGMHQFAQDRITQMLEMDTRSRQWLSNWAQRHNLYLRYLEPLEALRMDFATTGLIRRWFQEMVELVQSVPVQLRWNADEVMITITRSRKWVVGPGQQVFSRKTDKLPHFTIMACFNALGLGPLPMIVVPNLVSASVVFQEFRELCTVTSTKNGWVNGDAWIDWTTAFCQWVDQYREHLGVPGRAALLFVDGAPTRGNARALEIFRAHGIHVVTFPPHLTHVLQPVDVSWARSFKAKFVDLFRTWSSPDLEPFLISRLHPTRELSAVMLQRGQIVAAACEAVSKTTCASLCMRAFITTGLSDHVGRFSAERPLRSRYVRDSEDDPERDGRRGVTDRMALGSRLLTADACYAELRQRADGKARWRRKPAPQQVTMDDVAAEDADNFYADEGPEFEGFAIATEMAYPPTLGTEEEV